MARLSRVKSPQKGEEEIEDIDEEASDALGASSPLGNGGDGKTLHLGSDLPDLPPTSWDTQQSDQDATSEPPIANMGNAESREETNHAVHAVSDELARRRGAAAAAAAISRPSTGKLKRPSDGLTNPAYRNPVLAPPTQRKLREKNGIRKSAYDLEDSPDKTSPVRVRAQDRMLQFSPTRTERKNKQHVTELREQEDAGSPRRSTRNRTAVVEAEMSSVPAHEKLQLPSDTAQGNEGEEPATQNAMFTDFVPATIVQHYQEEEAAAGAAEDDEDEIEVAAGHDDAVIDVDAEENAVENRPDVEEVEPEDKPARKNPRGRPPKRTSGAKPGKPAKKSVGTAQEGTELRRSPRKPKATGAGDDAEAEKPTQPNRKQNTTLQAVHQPESSPGGMPAESALENLRRRRSQEHLFDDVNEDVYELSEASEDEPDKQADENPTTPPRRVLKAKQLFGSKTDEDSLFVERPPDSQEQPNQSKKRTRESPRQKGADAENSVREVANDYDDEEELDEPEPPTKKRKGRPAKNTVPLTRKRPRKSKATIDEQAAFAATDNEPRVNHRRFFGQWSALMKVFEGLDKIGCNKVDGLRQVQNQPELRDDDVKAAVKLVKEARNCFAKLKDLAGELEADDDPAGVVDDIRRRVEGLRGLDEDFPTDFKNQRKSIGIYFHLIPTLTVLVRSALLVYESIDKDEVPEGQITVWHLQNITEIMEHIIKLERTVDQNYAKPDSNLAIVHSMHSYIAIPLRNIKLAFMLHIQNHEYGIQQTRRKEAAAEQRALRLDQDERRSRQEDRIRTLRAKWKRLHEERIWAEGGIMRREKREHLQIPDNLVEMDQDGMPFERTELFHARVGPPPGLVDAATTVYWTLPELSALCDGLKQYAGANAYERIFRRYCGKGRELNRFNVTEIVTTAAGIREGLKTSQMNDYGDVEEWVSEIYVWTKGHHALGKENDDSLVEDEDGVET